MKDAAHYNEGSVTLGRSAVQDNNTSTSGNQQQGAERAHRDVEGNSPRGNVAEYEDIDNEAGDYLQAVATEGRYIAPAVVYENQRNVTNPYEQLRK